MITNKIFTFALGLAITALTSYPSHAVEGIFINTRNGSASLQYYGTIDGELWRHDIKNDLVVAHKKIYAGPASRPAISPDGKHVAFIKKTGNVTGKVVVIDINGNNEIELADCLRNSLVDFPHNSWVYFTMGGFHESTSGQLKRVNVETKVVQTVMQIKGHDGKNSRVAQLQIANDLSRAVVRTGDSESDPNGSIVALDLNSDNKLDQVIGTRYSCGSGFFADGQHAMDGWGDHDGFDIRRYSDAAKITSFSNDAAFKWPPNSGQGDPVDTHHAIFNTGASTNSDRWMCIVTGGDRDYKWHSALLINWKDQRCIFVTKGLAGPWDNGDFWVGPVDDPGCSSDSQCNDNNPCSVDTCSSGSCKHTDVAGCCVTSDECNDGDVCTNDSCASNICKHSAILGCCKDAKECADGDVCTADTCSNNRCVFSPIVDCCTGAAQCNDQNPCTKDGCTSNKCQHSPIADCCTKNSACEDGDVCTSDVCVNNSCQHSPVTGCCGNDNQCDDKNICTKDACTQNQCQHEAVAACCQNDADCQDINPCTDDSCDVPSGTCKNIPRAGCCSVDTDCDDGLTCTKDTCVSSACQHTPIAGCCTQISQCDDNNPCTNDTCVSNECTNAQVAGCCTDNLHCNDDNPCTSDLCQQNKCSHVTISGCCLLDEQCEDGSQCSKDICLKNKCNYTPLPNCCTIDDQCADNNPCTDDTCEASTGTCSNAKRPGCCAVDTDCEDEDSCTLDRCNLTSNVCEHNPTGACKNETDPINDSGIKTDAGLSDKDVSDGNLQQASPSNEKYSAKLHGGCSSCGAVPCPTTTTLSLLGFVLLVFIRRRKNSKP